jgi:hypothetical protein
MRNSTKHRSQKTTLPQHYLKHISERIATFSSKYMLPSWCILIYGRRGESLTLPNNEGIMQNQNPTHLIPITHNPIPVLRQQQNKKGMQQQQQPQQQKGGHKYCRRQMNCE